MFLIVSVCVSRECESSLVVMSASAEENESFIKACRDGDLVRFTELAERADVNYVSESVHGIKYTPLGISIVFNHEIIAHKLLDHPDIDVNKKTCESTALHYACLRNSISLIEAICAKVIKFQQFFKKLQTPSFSLA